MEDLLFNDAGLIPAIVQDASDGAVLMLAWMNREALERTRASGQTWFWSRSRKRLWHKGAESGNIQEIREILYDCDGDALLIKVRQGGSGAACHTGQRSCFYRTLEGGAHD